MTSLRTRRRLVRQLEQAGIRDRRVLDTILNTPRHRFVDEALASRAYENTALPIGYNQTISQPYIVALMTEALLAGKTPDKVLEIGTGSAYQTAVLAALAERVFSVERIGKLLEQARERIRELNIKNVRLKHDDGYVGWPRYQPFDGIMVTAAAGEIADELLDQLAVGGRLVAPLGEKDHQELWLIERRAFGYERHFLCAVSFVPMLAGVL